MILFLAAALAQASPACPAGQSAEAQVCRALKASGSGDNEGGAQLFEQAAIASGAGPARDRALAAAGNLWIAAGEPGKAALALDRAIDGGGLHGEQRGEALLDRARAAEAQNDLKTARAKSDEAMQTIASDPFLWYFSAALSIREGDKDKAQASINRALSLAPGDATILFEAGHVAHFRGEIDKARDYWTQAIKADVNGAIGKAAQEAIAMLSSAQLPTR